MNTHWRLAACYLACVLVHSVASLQGPQVTIEQGTLRGTYMESSNGKTFAAFQGIPYAKPPVGKNRFKDPAPAKPWRGVWNAEAPGSECLQYIPYTQQSAGDEDCLFVNVYTPMTNGSQPLDVIVNIHGGAFMHGASHWLGPKYLMERDVVVVSLNYRLGILGFFSTADDVVPGNNGLKDQAMALRWVHKNIAVFGGNPDKVTLFGCSAGGSSVHFHYLSPLSRGLFHQGVSLSGTALNHWATAEGLKERGERLGELVGCPTATSRDLVDCLRRRPARSLVAKLKSFNVWLGLPFAPWGPIVEVAGPGAFISEEPIDVIKRGGAMDVPWITGVTSEEGLYPAAEFVTSAELTAELARRWDELVPIMLDFTHTVPPEQHAAVAQRIKTFYLGDKPAALDTADELVQMAGDRLFKADGSLAAQLQAKHNKAPVYFYQFAYRGQNSLSDLLSKTKEVMGSSHGDDIAYVFEAFYCLTDGTEADRAMTRLMISMWTYFAQTGNPSPSMLQWPALKAGAKALTYLHLGSSTDFEIRSAEDFGNLKFWASLPIAEPQIAHVASTSASRVVEEL